MKLNKDRILYFLAFLLGLVVIAIIVAYSSGETADLTKREIVNAGREEIQRYFGYEKLLVRYFTLPYDISINNNQIGQFVTVGYLSLIFIPIIFLFRNRKKSIRFIVGLLACLTLITISLPNSVLFSEGTTALQNTSSNLLEFIRSSQGNFVSVSVACLHLVAHSIYSVVEGPLSMVTADKDYITYPIVISLFFLLLLAAKYWNINGQQKRSVYIFSISLCFMWFLLGAGIIWYAYLPILLVLSLLAHVFFSIKVEDLGSKFMKWSSVLLVSSWILIGFVGRLSNVNMFSSSASWGKNVVSPGVFLYNANKVDGEKKYFDLIHSGGSLAFDEINSNLDKRVYRVGTSFNYFIKNNHLRVVEDNQLNKFYSIVQSYPDKKEVSQVFKASNIGYVIIDLQTPSLDRTPHQTLMKKFGGLMQYVDENPSVALLHTDRVVRKEIDGAESEVYGMFGSTIVRPGSYAIFKIL